MAAFSYIIKKCIPPRLPSSFPRLRHFLHLVFAGADAQLFALLQASLPVGFGEQRGKVIGRAGLFALV